MKNVSGVLRFARLAVYSAILVFPVAGMAQEKQPAETVDIQQMKSAIQAEQRSFDAEYARLVSEKNKVVNQRDNAKEYVGSVAEEVAALNGTLAGIKNLERSVINYLSPIVNVLAFFAIDTIDWVFPVTIINICLYLWMREKPFFDRYKISVIVVAGVLLALFASPSMAQEKEKQEESKPTLAEQLAAAFGVLSKSTLQRYILILENDVSETVLLPTIDVGESPLVPLRTVRRGTPGYQYTLAALYVVDQRRGKAIEAIEKMFESEAPRKGFSREEQELLVRAVGFLLDEGKTTNVTDLLDKNLIKFTDASVLLGLVERLDASGMQESADKALGRAGDVVGRDVGILIKVAERFHARGKKDDADRLVVRAVESADELDQIMAVVRFVARTGLSGAVEKVSYKALLLSGEPDKYMQVVDTFREAGQTESADKAYGLAVDSIRPSTKSFENLLLKLTDLALERKMYDQSLRALNKLATFLSNPREYKVEDRQLVYKKEELPAGDRIALQTLQGTIFDAQKYTDKSNEAYQGAVGYILKNIIDRYGYEVDINLNDFYYLKGALEKANDTYHLSQLAPLYGMLTSEQLKRLKENNERILSELREEVRRIGEEAQEEVDKLGIGELLKEKERLKKKVFLSYLRVLSIAIATLIILIGCAYKGWLHTLKVKVYKMYAFLTKFMECNGWVSIFTVIGIPSGLFIILIAQMLEIFQGQHKELVEINERGMS